MSYQLRKIKRRWFRLMKKALPVRARGGVTWKAWRQSNQL